MMGGEGGGTLSKEGGNSVDNFEEFLLQCYL